MRAVQCRPTTQTSLLLHNLDAAENFRLNVTSNCRLTAALRRRWHMTVPNALSPPVCSRTRIIFCPCAAGLTERVKNTERDAVYPADERAHAARLADLSADIETNRHAISRLNASMETASQQHEAVREQAVAQAASQAEMAQQ